MHLTRTAIAAATTVIAGTLVLSACNDNSGSSDASSQSPAASATASATSAASSGGNATGGSTGSTGSTTGATTGSTSGGSSAGGTSPGRCHTRDLGFSWGSPGPNRDASQQQHADVVLANTSSHTCLMHGFPGVDLVNSGTQWPLTRDTHIPPATITLRPGGTARFTVTFLPWVADGNAASNDFAPTTLVVTPPNERTSYDLPWRWGHVLLQDGSTHPGTYISPVRG